MKSLALVLLFASGAAADAYKPTGEELEQIQSKAATLSRALKSLSVRHMDDGLIADVEIYHKAAEWILRYQEEFYTKAYVANTIAVLDRGLARAKELESGKAEWTNQKGRLARAYRSRVDGSVQPYGLIIPDSYDGQTPVRLDVVLHGRGATLNEVSFLAAHDAQSPIPANQDYLQLDIFGRTNNAYRWAGETDVFEALASVQKRYKIDARRIVLRGFSMGGAGTWHIGLHYPDRWAAIEAGAGFTETVRYAKQSNLPDYQQPALRIYDAVGYALNAFNVPTVGYGGEDDPQLQGSANIREELTREGFAFEKYGLNWRTQDLRALFLVGPKTGHKFHPDSKQESDQFINAVIAGQTIPNHLRFVTYTARYNRCFWVTVDGLEKHYERAEVDAERSDDHKSLTVTSTNVARLILPDPTEGQAIRIEGQEFSFKPHDHVAASALLLEKKNGAWSARDTAAMSLESETTVRKRHALQGPIDDAFMESFLCVRPTGTANHQAVKDYAERTLSRFAGDFARFLRGDVRIKDDTAVTLEDIAGSNLILFGDPASNKLIARVIGKLPVRWSKDSIVMGDRKFNAAEHVPVLIYPNPLNAKRYVVINSGHTFHEADFRGTNALLFPRMGDYAVVRIKPEGPEVVMAGLFNENWQFH